jgi:hypothetical protein
MLDTHTLLGVHCTHNTAKPCSCYSMRGIWCIALAQHAVFQHLLCCFPCTGKFKDTDGQCKGCPNPGQSCAAGSQGSSACQDCLKSREDFKAARSVFSHGPCMDFSDDACCLICLLPLPPDFYKHTDGTCKACPSGESCATVCVGLSSIQTLNQIKPPLPPGYVTTGPGKDGQASCQASCSSWVKSGKSSLFSLPLLSTLFGTLNSLSYISKGRNAGGTCGTKYDYKSCFNVSSCQCWFWLMSTFLLATIAKHCLKKHASNCLHLGICRLKANAALMMATVPQRSAASVTLVRSR